MPAALPADWQGIRLLATQGHSITQLSEMTGIAEGTLKARSTREGWHSKAIAASQSAQSKGIAVAVAKGQMRPHATSAVDTLATTLAENKRRTKLALSGYLGDASEELADIPKAKKLEYTDAALQLATMASKVYPEDHQEAQVSLQFFSITQERVESGQKEPPECQIYDIPGDEMDDPML